METSNILLLSLNVVAVVGVVGVVYIAVATARTARKVDLFVDWMNSVRPELESSIQVFQAGLAEFKKATDVLTDVVTDVRDLTGAAKKIALPALTKLEGIKHSVQGFMSRVGTIFSAVSGASANGNSREQNAQVKKPGEVSRG